jgi:hypothetical protein
LLNKKREQRTERDETLKSTELIGSSSGRITWKFASKTEVTLRNKGEKRTNLFA